MNWYVGTDWAVIPAGGNSLRQVFVRLEDYEAIAAELDRERAGGTPCFMGRQSARISELEAQEKVATDFIVRVLEAIDIDVPKPCDVIISLETVWYQVLGHIEGLKGELTDKDARIRELEAIIARNDTTESFKCTECGAWHVRKVEAK